MGWIRPCLVGSASLLNDNGGALNERPKLDGQPAGPSDRNWVSPPRPVQRGASYPLDQRASPTYGVAEQ